MVSIKRVLNNPEKYMRLRYIIDNVIFRRLFLIWRRISRYIPSDKLFLKIYYRLGMGEKLDLRNPVTYTQKIQWLKLHNTNPIYTKMVDKYEAREIVKNILGEGYLIPLLGKWDKYEEIDFHLLPLKFVLKTTHDSGTTIICHDKNLFDYHSAKKKLTKALKRNYFYLSREYPYKNIVPKIIAEEFIQESENGYLADYKFFCFNGIPELLLIVTNEKDKKYNNFFDINFNPLELSTGFEFSPYEIDKPENYDHMVEIAKRLSSGIPHVRIDLYNIHGMVYFGEFTFHHSGGLIQFSDIMWNKWLGDIIMLDQ